MRCRGHFKLLGYQKISNLEKTCVRRFVVNDLIYMYKYVPITFEPWTLATQLYLLKDLGHHMKDTTGEPHSMLLQRLCHNPARLLVIARKKHTLLMITNRTRAIINYLVGLSTQSLHLFKCSACYHHVRSRTLINFLIIPIS